jgi:CDP-diacylglycerol--glycerol-3-phosphate 3-phosphatidyltransferase
MSKRAYYMVNAITLYRIIAAPVMIVFLVINQVHVFKWMLAISFFTDAIDGHLARKYNVNSMVGAKLDSIGDDLTVAVGVAGIFVFQPAFLREVATPLLLLTALFSVQVALAFMRYGRMSSFHTYAAKVAALFQGSFLILFFFLENSIPVLFYATVIITAIDLVEEIIIVIILREWKTDVKGLYWVLRYRPSDD